MPLDPQTFFGVPWRSIVTGLDGTILTFLDKRASQRTVSYALGRSAVSRGGVPSEDPEVNIPADDGSPFLSFSDRLLYQLRRENDGTSVYRSRYSGILLPLQREGGTENGTSTYTAFDPWQVLYARPVINNSLTIPGSGGWTRKGVRGDQIVIDLLTNMKTFCATGPYRTPEAFIDFGQTAFYEGTIEATDVIGEGINFSQGCTVGAAFDQLVEGGYLEIVLEPIYDPLNRPGMLAELNVYEFAGSHRNQAIMAWDKPGRSLVAMDLLHDGTALRNKFKYYTGQGPAVALQTDAASVARYGEMWALDFITGENVQKAVEVLAAARLTLAKAGKSTLTVSPAAARSPIPFLDYGLGDMIPVYASNAFGEVISPTFSLDNTTFVDLFRVYGIEVTLDDNDLERVDRLLLSKEAA